MLKEQKGITLIALVVTIIVLLILAGISIAMLTGDNGIITNAQASRSNTAYRTADEQMRLAYMAVRTEIAAKLANNTAYEAISLANATELKDLVTKDLEGYSGNKSSWTVKLELATDGVTATGIFMKCEDASILANTESNGKPLTDGKVCGRINLEKRGATYDFDEPDVTSNVDNGDNQDNGENENTNETVTP